MSLKQIKEKLSQCYKNHKPVLLYNDTSNKRSNIILDIHVENGGSLYDVKYGGNKEKRVFLQDIADERNEKERGIKRTIKDCIGTFERFQLDETQRKIHNKVRKNFKGKKKAYRCFDCAGKNSKSVFDLLINYHFWDEVKIPASRYGLIPIENMPGNEFLKDYRNPVIIYGSNLLDYKGTLFVDNLKCSNSEDVLYYYKLAEEIRNNKISVNLLIVYVQVRDSFPEIFLNLFEQICIEEEKAVVEPVKEVARPEVEKKTGVYNWSIDNTRNIFCKGQLITKLPPLQFKLFECLYKKPGKYVKNETLEKCWKNSYRKSDVFFYLAKKI